MKNKQADMWSSSFGKDYTDRCKKTPDQYDEMYSSLFGITRTVLNREFIGDVDRSVRILEVGTNVGNHLELLSKMGFRNLYGIELQFYPIQIAKPKDYGVSIVQGAVFNIPFKDSTFDIVFTSGVLIHVAPKVLPLALNEIYRCTRRYIWGFEFFNECFKEIEYRGEKELLWEGDYSREYLKHFPGLKIIKEKKYKYLNKEGQNCMYFLEKK